MADKKTKKSNPVPHKIFTEEIIKSKKQGKLTELAGHYIIVLTKNRQKGLPYHTEDIKNDVLSKAIEILCEKWNRFEPSVGSNAFSFFSTMALNALFEGMNEYTKNKRNAHISYDAIFDDAL